MAKHASHWPRKRQYWARQWARIHAPISRADVRRRRVKLRRERQFQKWVTFIAEACVQASLVIQDSYAEVQVEFDRAFEHTDHPTVTVQSSEYPDGPWFTHTIIWPRATMTFGFTEIEETPDPSDASQVMPGVDSEHVDTEAWEAEVQKAMDEAMARREGYR